MAVKNYMINDKWLDIAKQNIVEVESTDGVIGSVKVNGEEYGGGGGSSDFSTAEVEVTVNGEETFYITNVVEIVEEEMFWAEGFETGTYTLVLYKGTFEGSIATPEGYKVSSASGTGGVTVSTTHFGVYTVDITGDGTLTVNITRA